MILTNAVNNLSIRERETIIHPIAVSSTAAIGIERAEGLYAATHNQGRCFWSQLAAYRSNSDQKLQKPPQ
jgi:hypothetical protein